MQQTSCLAPNVGLGAQVPCQGLPKSDVVPPLALIVEAVNPIDGCTLVIATQQKKVFRVFDLQQACSATQRQSDSTLLWILCMCGAGYAPCTRAAGKWFPGSACRGPHSRPGKGSWPLAGNRHTRRAAANRNTGHECLLGKGKASVRQFTRLACVYLKQPSARTDRVSACRVARARLPACSPQILIGASSSSRLGWLIKISFAVRHSWRICEDMGPGPMCLMGRERAASRRHPPQMQSGHKTWASLVQQEITTKLEAEEIS